MLSWDERRTSAAFVSFGKDSEAAEKIPVHEQPVTLGVCFQKLVIMAILMSHERGVKPFTGAFTVCKWEKMNK